jgi:hypothetical protein
MVLISWAAGSTGDGMCSIGGSSLADATVSGSSPKSSPAGSGGDIMDSGSAGGAGGSGALDCASASAITPSTKFATSDVGPPANQVVLQRAQRTVRPEGGIAAGSIM